jgi:hypothetical protein
MLQWRAVGHGGGAAVPVNWCLIGANRLAHKHHRLTSDSASTVVEAEEASDRLATCTWRARW